MERYAKWLADVANGVNTGRAATSTRILTEKLDDLRSWARAARIATREGRLLKVQELDEATQRIRWLMVPFIHVTAEFQRMCADLAGRQGIKLNLRAMLQDQTLVGLVYPRTIHEHLNRMEQADFHAAHGLLTIRFLRHHLPEAANLAWGMRIGSVGRIFPNQLALVRLAELVQSAVWTFVSRHVFPVEVQAKKNLPYGMFSSRVVHSREFYEAARVSFYRDVPTRMFDDHLPQPAATIRLALELKVREALEVTAFDFCELPGMRGRINHCLRHNRALAWIVGPGPGRDGVRRIDVSVILNAWTQLRMQAPRPADHLRRFYTWGNLGVHAGYRATIPETWYALEYLQPVLRGDQIGNAWTANPIRTELSGEEQAAVLKARLKLGDEWHPRLKRTKTVATWISTVPV